MNEPALKQAARAWHEQGRRAVVVTVQDARGSVPRGTDTRMVVSTDAQLGTIGGGHLEWQALQSARRALAGGLTLPAQQRYALGPSLGQCCGGALRLAFEALDEASLERWPLPVARSQVWLYGAGHVGTAIARLMIDLEIDLRWIEVREEAFPRSDEFPWGRASRLHPVVSDGPAADVAEAPAGSHHLVMTHSHALDFDIVHALLRRTDLGMVGLIGSGTKRARFGHRLEALGVSATQIAGLVCPIGLPQILGKEPQVIAVSVVAQILGLASSERGSRAARTEAVHSGGLPAS